MRQQTLPEAIVSFIVAVAGFMSYFYVIIGKSGLIVVILAIIYVVPLFIDSLRDLSRIDACGGTQFFIDKLAVIIGSIVITCVMAVFVLEKEGLLQTDTIALNYILAILPAVFLVKKLYAARIKWVQNTNIAKGYFVDSIEVKG